MESILRTSTSSPLLRADARDQSAPFRTSVAGGVYPQARYRRRESCVTACGASVDHLRYRPRSVSCQMSLPVAIINGRSASMPALPTARSSCASSASLSRVSASIGGSSMPLSRSSSMPLARSGRCSSTQHRLLPAPQAYAVSKSLVDLESGSLRKARRHESDFEHVIHIQVVVRATAAWVFRPIHGGISLVGTGGFQAIE